MNYFVDDIRFPDEVTWTKLPLCEWVIIRNYEDFVSNIDKFELPTNISLDHDLGAASFAACINNQKYTGEEKTGFDCAKYLVEYCLNNDLELPSYTIHSLNPVGAANIRGLLDGFKKFQLNN